MIAFARLNKQSQRAFTLIELLVVLSIIVIISSMIFIKPNDQQNAVRIAAMQLEATLSQARNLARQTGMAHAVVFHIENYGDGRVMRNFGPNDEREHGGHWYAIIGPNKGAAAMPWTNEGTSWGYQRRWTIQPNFPPLVKVNQNFNDTGLDSYLNDVAISQVGPRYYLPPGVRFLALGDYDFGANVTDAKMWKTTISNAGLLDEFPKPWFGVLKPSAQIPSSIRPSNGNFVLYPWGGGDIDWENARNAQNMTAFGTLEGQTTNGNNHGILVNANQMDLCILFQADGSAVSTRPFAARSSFTKLKENNGDVYQTSILLEHPFYWSQRNSIQGPTESTTKNSGIHHSQRITGGFHITLARDVDEQENIYPEPGRMDVFKNEEDALTSILPLFRVYVNNFTASTTIRRYGDPMAEIKMNQSRLELSDVNQSYPTTGILLRPAYRHSYYADQLIPAKQDTQWNDTAEGWRGWFPNY